MQSSNVAPDPFEQPYRTSALHVFSHKTRDMLYAHNLSLVLTPL